MNATASISAVIDAISRDSGVTGSPSKIAQALTLLYPAGELKDTIERMLDDGVWSEDREPYVWLETVYRLI